MATAAKYAQIRDLWQASSPEQQRLLEAMKQVPDWAKVRDIQTVATSNRDDFLLWFKQRGFDFSKDIPPFRDRSYFAAGSLLDVLVKWLTPGEAYPHVVMGVEYPFVHMEHKTHKFVLYELPSSLVGTAGRPASNGTKLNTNFVVGLPTQTPDIGVWMMPHPKSVQKPLELQILAQSIAALDLTPKPLTKNATLHFPEVQHKFRPDLNYMVGLKSTDSRPGFGQQQLAAMVQENRLRLSPIGARAQSASAVTVRKMSMPVKQPLHIYIDTPFAFWITQKGVSQPIFVAWLDPSDWKAAGDLSPNSF